MKTKQELFFADSGNRTPIEDESVVLIVTSPAYPMIKMWDLFYGEKNPQIKHALLENNGEKAFDLMHRELDKTWAEAFRVLKNGGIVCVNIGDATRTVAGRFQLYSNHSRVIQSFKKLGFYVLPMILWHKKTNAPNKFMGSGMLPAGAYVTLEHEYILVFRKGPKRVFSAKQEREIRQRSAFFWEERNKWFSDIWVSLPGVSQKIKSDGLRQRSAAFPFELAYRLICMYSVQEDTVLDPFSGTGTTALSAMALGRNSISIEIDKSFREYIIQRMAHSAQTLNSKTAYRISEHIQFVEEQALKKSLMKYQNPYYNFPVMTAQERFIQLPLIESIECTDNNFLTVKHSLPMNRECSSGKKELEEISINHNQMTMEI